MRQVDREKKEEKSRDIRLEIKLQSLEHQQQKSSAANYFMMCNN